MLDPAQLHGASVSVSELFGSGLIAEGWAIFAGMMDCLCSTRSLILQQAKHGFSYDAFMIPK